MAEHFDVLIVGGGLAGAAMACELQDKLPQEKQIAILESQMELPEYGDEFDPRVVALTESSRQLLQRIGVWSSLKRPSPFTHMSVWDGDGTGEINYDGSHLGKSNDQAPLSIDEQIPALGHIVENSHLVAALRQKVDSSGRVIWLSPKKLQDLQEVSSGQWQVTCDTGEVVTAELIVAADGAQSKVRELAEFPMRQWSYEQSAIVTTVKTQKSHNKTTRQSFLSTGPLAFLPLVDDAGDEHSCSIVWSADTEESKRLMSLSDEEFAVALERALESRLGAITSVDKRHCLPLIQRHAARYVKPGLALIADAAHNIHPLAGQGINLGFLDVEALVSSLEWAVNSGESLGGKACLQRYERQRMSHNLSMMAAMETFKRLFGSRQLAVRWLRNVGLKWVDKQSLLKRFFVRQAMAR